MKHRDRATEQDGLLRPRLVDMIDMRHELVKRHCQVVIDGTQERGCAYISSDQLACILSPNFEGIGSGVAVGTG